MDAIRELLPFIEKRAALRWSSTAIAAVLAEAGYSIDAATLRSYRSRLRAKDRTADVGDGKPPAMDDQLGASTATSSTALAAALGDQGRSSNPEGAPTNKSHEREPSRTSSASGRRFNVAGNLPLQSA